MMEFVSWDDGIPNYSICSNYSIYILYNTIIMYYHPNYRYYIVLFIMSLLLYYHYWDEYSIINDSTIIMIDYRTTMIEQL